MIKKSLILVVVIIVFLSGCSRSDYVEPEKRTVVTSLILDYKQENYELIIETVTFKKQSDNTPYTPEYVKGSGEDIFSALNSAQNEISSQISLYHCSLLICKDSVFKIKKKEIFDFILNTPQISLGADLLVCRDTYSLLFDEENFLGYVISDAVNLKNAKTSILDIIKGNKSPYTVSVNEDKKIIITENLND